MKPIPKHTGPYCGSRRPKTKKDVVAVKLVKSIIHADDAEAESQFRVNRKKKVRHCLTMVVYIRRYYNVYYHTHLLPDALPSLT